eukprot:6719241-Pyramimonas_sp.AAC.1
MGGQDMCYQLVSPISTSKKYVKTNSVVTKMRVPFLAIKMDCCPGTSSAYAFEDAVRVDLLSLATFDDIYSRLSVYKVGPSDIAGCVDLVGEAPAVYVPGPRGFLEDGCPEYCVLKAVVDQGWVPGRVAHPHPIDQVPPACFHRPRDGGIKSYLQVLLCMPQLRIRGLLRVHVRQPQTYYRLLMASESPGDVPPDMGDK